MYKRTRKNNAIPVEAVRVVPGPAPADMLRSALDTLNLVAHNFPTASHPKRGGSLTHALVILWADKPKVGKFECDIGTFSWIIMPFSFRTFLLSVGRELRVESARTNPAVEQKLQ